MDNHAGICSKPALNQQVSNNSIIVPNVGLLTSWFRGKCVCALSKYIYAKARIISSVLFIELGKERPRAECAQTLAHEVRHFLKKYFFYLFKI